MQIKLFTIPVLGGEALSAELNAFLRSHKVLKVNQELISVGQQGFWCFCVTYMEGKQAGSSSKNRVDYKEVLDEASFARFVKLRELRKQIAKEDAVPAFAVFTDQELAELAKLEEITLKQMKLVKGIGSKKIEKYGAHFISALKK
ncbi:MAG: HRDC domain-containing protein [Bacteroidota bacterium]